MYSRSGGLLQQRLKMLQRPLRNPAMTIFDLSIEVLAEILCQCSNPTISETCKTFAAIAFSTPSRWTTIFLGPRQFSPDGPDFLQARILRAKGALLHVCIGPVTEYMAEAPAVCKALAMYNTQIREFKLTASTAFMAGGVVHDVFPNVTVFPALEVLSVLSESESNYLLTAVWPRLDLVLANASTMFPNLQKLRMNSFYDSVPILPLSASFSHLDTLILDGSLEDEIAHPALVAALLNCTPQLETLWMKHHWWENPHDVTPPTASGIVKGRPGSEISLDIRLPRLKRLAISAPGTACDLMGCISAPVLEDLHLDGSRGPGYEEDERPDYGWGVRETTSVENALKLFASRCQNVRRFAVTDTYLTHDGWDWILFGEERRGPPFPKLECIALHRILDIMWSGSSGFNDRSVEKLAREPMIPLKRLALLCCDFPLRASTLVDAFRASGAKELEYDNDVPQHWGVDERKQLEELGVSLTHQIDSEMLEDKWWTYGHSTDAADSGAY